MNATNWQHIGVVQSKVNFNLSVLSYVESNLGLLSVSDEQTY